MKLGTLALVGILAGAAHADSGDPKIQFEKYTLPNGLEVILAPDKTVPLVAVSVWYHVGAGYEVPGRSGFAHLFEHMMFQGSKYVVGAKGDDPHFKVLRQIGSDTVNGTTNFDRTNYFEVVPSNQLEVGLWLESDRMGHLLEVLTKSSLDNQIDVVRNERRQSYDNRAYAKSDFAQYAALYPEGHPYRYMVIGKHEDLTAASVEDVKNFFRTWYVPANATLTLAGDFEVDAAKAAVAKWFGSFPASKKPTPITIPAPPQVPTEVSVDDNFAKLRQIVFTWHSPAVYKDGDAELSIAANALGAEGRGRLYKALMYDRQLAQSVRVAQDGAQFSGEFEVTVQVRDDAKLDEVKRIVLDEIGKLAKEPLSDKEIKRVVVSREAGVIRTLESFLARAEQLQRYNHFLGDPDRLTWDLDRSRNATPDAIRAAVAKYLVPDKVITIITNPTGGAK